MIASSLVPSRHRLLQEQRLRSALLSTVIALSAGLAGQTSANAQRVPDNRPAPIKDAQLFVGDTGDNSVKQFAASGTYVGPFVASGAAGLEGPRGMIFTRGQLVVVNQNVDATTSGEVLKFDGRTGTFVGKLVASSDRNAPFAPRGLVRGGPGNSFYVADTIGPSSPCATGNVKKYDDAGAFLGNLDLNGLSADFHPRGVVFGPDGLLYVSSSGCLDPTDTQHFNPLTGYIARFNAKTGKFVDVFASDATIADLHRPEGLVFDRAGNLWVTSFRASASDTDKILKLNGKTGALIDSIVLSTPPAPRAYAQAIIFGPGGNLYIPISGSDPQTTGQVRRCNPTTKACDIIVPANAAGGALLSGWYAIFRNSDPATLEYVDQQNQNEDQDNQN